MPLFLARGQPERLKGGRGNVGDPAKTFMVQLALPPVGGVVSRDVSRSVTTGRGTPEGHENFVVIVSGGTRSLSERPP